MPEASTSVHNIETTGNSHDWPTYRQYRESLCTAEYKATETLYAEMDRQEGRQRLHLLSECRRFAWFSRDNVTGLVHVCSNSCRLRWCPICSGGRAKYITSSVTDWLKHVKHPRFLTLTLKHSNSPLDHQIDTIYKKFRALRKDKQFRQYVTGGVWFFQVKLSAKSDQWHPHVHCLITGKYMPHDWISRKWLRITKSSNIVDIRAVTDSKQTAEYVARYCARPARLSRYPLELNVEIFKSMHGRRLCGTWGTAKGVSLSPPRYVPKEKYTSLGTWSTVMSLRTTSSYARIIVKCWMEKTPIADEITLQNVDDFIEDTPAIGGTEVDENLPPPYLW